jgi:hypothetical protein
MSGQFEGMDTLEDRRTILDLFVWMGKGLPERLAREKRAAFLRRLLYGSTTGFKDRPMLVTPCSAAEAYHIFVAVTGCMGVSIGQAARRLESEVRGR